MQREESDEDDSEDDNRPPFIYDVESLEQALGKAAEDSETYNPNRKKLAELQKRFKELIPGEGEEGDSNDDEVPTLVDAMEDIEDDEELEDMEEDDEEARKSGWTNEFTAGDIIPEEFQEEEKPKDKRKQKKENGLLGGKMVSIDASTLDISGLETEATSREEVSPKTIKKKSKKAAKQPEIIEEDVEEDITSVVADQDDEAVTTTMSKKKKVQWVLDKNTVRRKFLLRFFSIYHTLL
ncbi:hypothetical protein BGW37DRAFT_181700 [Umbelopsis sp. PMI_123]|nr:hypothetical protein BGW37DRAFT_181700 [Umbelopsis sp. PMI_123]